MRESFDGKVLERTDAQELQLDLLLLLLLCAGPSWVACLPPTHEINRLLPGFTANTLFEQITAINEFITSSRVVHPHKTNS